MTDSETKITTRPRYNISENDNSLELKIALPGVTKEQIDLQIENHQLKLNAERTDISEENWNLISGTAKPDAYQLELRINTDYDLTQADANFENNVLKLTVPTKTPIERTLKIQ